MPADYSGSAVGLLNLRDGMAVEELEQGQIDNDVFFRFKTNGQICCLRFFRRPAEGYIEYIKTYLSNQKRRGAFPYGEKI